MNMVKDGLQVTLLEVTRADGRIERYLVVPEKQKAVLDQFAAYGRS